MLDRLFSLVLVIFLYVSIVPTLGFVIKDIYEDHTFAFANKPLEINHTVHVHENATLTIKPGVKIKFSAEGGFNILGQLVANGSETLPIDVDSSNVEGAANIFSYDLAVGFHILRLISGNGFSTGRLEVFHEGIWGTVCSDWWSQINSDVACRELGFSTGTLTTEFSNGEGQIWLDDVRCTKADNSMKHCSHRGFGNHNCEHNQDVGLRCTESKLSEKPQDRSKGLFHFSGKRKSFLKFVRIQGTQQHQAKNLSPLKFSYFKRSAIVCEGKCPYFDELHITGFAVAVEVRNYVKNLLRNINISNCLYGVMALNGYGKDVSFHSNIIDVFGLEKITVTNSRVGIMLANHSSLPIELKEIAITNCFSGVSISKAILTNVRMSGLQLDTGVNAISSTTTLGHLQNVDICSNYHVYNRSFPVEIVHSTYGANVNPCSMVGELFDHVIRVMKEKLGCPCI
ncbi:protein bark beetle-like [Dendronephthya gigantea]|uniref:protein bark beetle-like n=1 Tax=Dendronephthya gigantea TaxID=151771 RepID=UPI00106AD0C2|nr:protein bark beetle-like [Dendronephthya gigantea]